ncbi:MAG: hypothetical protein NC417_08855 [Candidatus Gastranaerophilales bacterium]|nr:hypothetical protein [Candidatus Gastranaerophilales bacterium]
MDVAMLGTNQAKKGSYFHQTGRVGTEKSADFRDALSSSLGTNRSAKAPYDYLSKDGVITYKGVTFVCDYDRNAICLGDMSDPKKVLDIPLSGGGSLRVNRSQIGALSKAIGMFSPEDVNLILRAIALDQKCKQELNKIDELENSPENFSQTES